MSKRKITVELDEGDFIVVHNLSKPASTAYTIIGREDPAKRAAAIRDARSAAQKEPRSTKSGRTLAGTRAFIIRFYHENPDAPRNVNRFKTIHGDAVPCQKYLRKHCADLFY